MASIPGSSPPGPVPSACAVGEGGNKAGGGRELRAMGFAGTWPRPVGARNQHQLSGPGEHPKLFRFVLPDPPIL